MRPGAWLGVVLLLPGVGVLPAQGLRVVRSAHFELTIQQRDDPARVLDALERAYVTVESVGLDLPARIPVRAHTSTAEFARVSGTSRNHLAAYRSGMLHLQPVRVLVGRRWFERTFRHELVHLALEGGATGGLPRWLNEGLASHVAGEHYGNVAGRFRGAAELDAVLATETRPERLKAAYAAAERLAARLVTRHGWPAIGRLIRQTANGGDFAEQFTGLCGTAPDLWVRRELHRPLKGR